MQVNQARRISPRVRRRIIEIRAAVLQRFRDELGYDDGPPASTVPATDLGRNAAQADADAAVARLDLDALVPLLVPAQGTRGRRGASQPAVRMILGLDPVPGAETADWASQTAIADALGLTRGRLGQIGPAARDHWASLAELRSVRDEVIELIAANGGVVGVRELEPLLVESRGTGLPDDEGAIAARAVIRAAVEAELRGDDRREGRGRLTARRRGERVIVGLDDPEAGIDGAALTGFAAALGDHADALVRQVDDVIPQDRAVPQLREVPPVAGAALPDGRLVRLAASTSQHVGVSSALELYPLDLDPIRATRLARQGLVNAGELTVDDVRSRLLARFPRMRVPDRPELDAVLAASEVAVVWDTQSERFRREQPVVGNLTSYTSMVSRASTRMAGQSDLPRVAQIEVSPEVAEAIEIDGRLERSLRTGGFLILRTPTNRGTEVRRELARFTGEPQRMVVVDLEAWFLEELRAVADDRGGIRWDVVLDADLAPAGTVDYTNLRILTHDAALRVEQRVLRAGARVLAYNPGLFARYEELGVIDRLRDAAGRADAELRSLWLVVFGSTADPLPMIDGRAVPVIGPSEWVSLSDAWLGNKHRHQAATGTNDPSAPGATA
jgi:hypothetical protein